MRQTMPMPWYADDEDVPSDAEAMFDAQCYAMLVDEAEANGFSLLNGFGIHTDGVG